MKFNQLNEAIIKVPQSTLKVFNQYVSSLLYFKIKQYQQNYDRFVSPDVKNHPAADKIKANVFAECDRTLKVLSSKYGAKNISSMTYANIVGKHINIPFDAGSYVKELNFKKLTPEVLEKIGEVNLELVAENSTNSNARGKMAKVSDNKFEIHINIAFNPQEVYASCMRVMGTVYHELQHFVQRSVIEVINKKSNQVQMKKNYDDHDKGYYTSGIEYTPQIGNIVDGMKAEAEVLKHNDDLPSDPKEAFNAALKEVLARDDRYSARRFMIHVHQNSQKKYREILTTLYKEFMKYFHENQPEDESEDEPDDQLDVETNEMKTLAKEIKSSRYGDTKFYGRSMEELTAIEYQNEEYDWILRINLVAGKQYLVSLSSTEFKEKSYMNYPTVEKFASYVTAIDCTADDVYETMDEMAAENLDIDAEKAALVKKFGEWANMIGIQFEPTKDGFELDGAEYILDDNRGRISIESPEFPELYWLGSPTLLTEVMKYILRLLKQNPEAVYAEINRGESLIKAARRLRNL